MDMCKAALVTQTEDGVKVVEFCICNLRGWLATGINSWTNWLFESYGQFDRLTKRIEHVASVP